MLRTLRHLKTACAGCPNSILVCLRSALFEPRQLDDRSQEGLCQQLRDFIQKALYSPVTGYFNREDVPVGALPEALVFSDLAGEAEYKRALHAAYEKLQVRVCQNMERIGAFQRSAALMSKVK